MMFTEVSRRAPTVPGSLRQDDLRYSFPSSPVAGMLHVDMAIITVRVAPRSGRTAVESGPDGVVVRAAPEGGRATEEAARALAEALGVPWTRVRLQSGARSRTKTFDVDGLSSQDLQQRMRRR